MISLTIDGQTFEVKEGTTVLQAAASIGIHIPTLCYHKDLSPFGGCRFCVVEVQGSRLPMTSCVLPVSPGMVVQTETASIIRHRRAILRMLLSNFYDGGYKRTTDGFDLDQESELAHWARMYDVDIRKMMTKKPRYPIDSDPNPFVWVDMNKCIQCLRCVRACAEIQGRFVWSQSYRGFEAHIVAGSDSSMLSSRCESCGACVEYCPTGALDNKMSVNAGPADRRVQTTCAYCGVGCQLILNVKDDLAGGRVIRVTSHPDPNSSSVNGKHLCLKGRYGYEFIHSPRRQTKPRVRQYLLEGRPRSREKGRFVDVSWDTALEVAARGLLQAREEHGSESVAVLASGKCLNEENYLLNKLTRQVLGSNHIDCSANVYATSVVDGLIQSLGLPAMSSSFADIASQARSLLVIGSNLTEQHPVFGAHIRQAVLRRKTKLVVASPDFINLDEYAALSLVHAPGTEAVLVNGLMHIMLQNGWQDQESIEKHPLGFAEAKARIDQYIPERVAEITGVPIDTLKRAAHILAHNRPVSIVWSAGLADPEHGKQSVQALANLQLLLGDLDKPGGGVNPLRSQNNIQGACDMGCLPDMLPGYQPITSAVVQEKFEQAWGAVIPTFSGSKASDILLGAGEGRVKALYILGEELISTSAEGAQVRRSLENCDFVVLQESLASETTRYADVLLPGVTFAEKTGTFTSSERRIQMVRQAIEPVGEARPDWEIIVDLANRIIQDSHPRPAPAEFAGWQYTGTEQIMQEIAALTPIYAGVSHARLAEGESLFWLVDSNSQPGSSFLKAGAFSDNVVRWTPAESITSATGLLINFLS
jgi:predicted molibdopterin-dependent oxidoreductase YjgC